MALSAMNKTSRARREILKIEKSLGGAAIDSIDVVTGDPIFRILIPRRYVTGEKPTGVDGWMIGRMDGWIDGWLGGWVDGSMGGGSS